MSLWSPQAGFWPREGTITVSGGDLMAAADHWNRLADRELFVPAENPQVVLFRQPEPPCGGAAACCAPVSSVTHQFGLTDPFERCEVYARLDCPVWPFLSHELGHALGFADTLGRRGRPGRDIMGGRPNQRRDRKLLEEAGYVTGRRRR